MGHDYFERRILDALRFAAPEILQTRLSSMADRDLAVALDVLVPEDRAAVLSRLPAAKAARVGEERDYMQRLFVSDSHRRIMAERLADVMEGKGSRRGGTWIAPGEGRGS